MIPEIQWDYGSDVFAAPCKIDCEHAAWMFRFWNNDFTGRFPFWSTLRDMMLHGY